MDIYTRLKNDHEVLHGLLTELVNLEPEDSYRSVLISQIEKVLVPHSRAEESVFYNSIRALNSDNSEVMHGFKEHLEAETLLRAIKVKEAADLNWKAGAIKLKEALEHHIAEEESKIFNEAKKLFSEEDARMMGNAFVEMKEKVSKEGFMKTTFDMIINLMPPRIMEKVRNLRQS